MDGSQPPAFRSKFVKSIAFHIEGVGDVPIQLSAVEDVRVGNETIRTRGDRFCHR
jgi:hypothetical protein